MSIVRAAAVDCSMRLLEARRVPRNVSESIVGRGGLVVVVVQEKFARGSRLVTAGRP